ncbi:hypothetical protein Tco_1009835, partial [Tanacetum coccineum]
MVAATVPFVTSFVTPTLEREGGTPSDSIFETSLWTRHPAERFMISSDSHDSNANAADDQVSFVVRSLISDPPIMTMAVATTVVADIPAIPVPRACNELVHPTPFADSASIGEANPNTTGPSHRAGTELSSDTFFCAVDHVAPLVRFSHLQHEFKGRKKFEGKCVVQAGWLMERDAEIASLKAQLSLKEAEAAEVIYLCGQVATVEAAEAARVNELNCLKEKNAALERQVAALESTTVIKDTELASSNAQIAKLTQDLSNFQLSCDGLSIKAASFESEKDKLVDQVFALKGTCSELRDEVLGIDAELMGMTLHLDEEFYTHFLTTVAGRKWIISRDLKLMDGLAAGIDHRKARRGLAEVAAYNPVAEASYVAAMNALCDVDFLLLAQLASHKDASMSDLMGLHHLEGPAAETLEANQLQPSPEQLMLSIHHSDDQVVIGETFLSFSLDVIHACVQRIRGGAAARRLSFFDAMVPLNELLSAKNLTGEASTSGVPVMATTTALST